MLYMSRENDKIKDLKKLYNKKYRDELGLFIVEGEHLVEEAYKNNLLKEIFILDGCNFNIDTNISYVSENIMKYISELSSIPKVIGVCYKKKEKKLGNRLLLLDDIQDPGNLGTIIRSSVAFNIDTIILSKTSVDLYNSKVLRSTQGMIFNINIIERDLDCFIDEIKEKNYKTYGTKVNGGKSIKSIEKVEKFAIIMGNEGNGVKGSLLDKCDEYLYIDMNSNCESLNVGVATSIILYELSK